MARALGGYGGKTSVKLRPEARPAEVKDYWTRDATPSAPPREVPDAPPQGDDPYLEAVRRVFAPRVRPWLPSPGHFPIPHQGPCAGGCGRQGTFRTETRDDDQWLCHNCLVASGEMPRRILLPPPMSDEEIAEGRARRHAEEAVRRWRGDAVEYERDRPTFLKVPHKDSKGRSLPKMVGKLDLCNVAMIQALQKDIARLRAGDEPTDEWIDLSEDGEVELVYFHAHSPSQRHFQTDCPAPLDTVVADFLRKEDIAWVFDYERQEDGRGILRWAPIYRFRGATELEYDGRWRVYLPEERWEAIGGVGEFKRRDGSVLLHIGEERSLIFSSPYIPEENAIILRRGRRAQ